MRIALIALIVGSLSHAQQANTAAQPSFGRIMFPGGTPQSGATPFGRILFPGTGAPAVARNVRANPVPPATHPRHGGAGLIPYPVFFGGNYLQYDPPQAPLASEYSQVPGQQDAAPVVIVNQYFRPDAPPPITGMPSQSAPAPVQESRVTAENQDTETIFLIAMKDHTIYAAKAYWVEDNTLNYITIQGSQNSASMDVVDRDLSRRLNRDRQVAFGLPSN
jgi:hypothetical protein